VVIVTRPLLQWQWVPQHPQKEPQAACILVLLLRLSMVPGPWLPVYFRENTLLGSRGGPPPCRFVLLFWSQQVLDQLSIAFHHFLILHSATRTMAFLSHSNVIFFPLIKYDRNTPVERHFCLGSSSCLWTISLHSPLPLLSSPHPQSVGSLCFC
jgi:hypothetical protein